MNAFSKRPQAAPQASAAQPTGGSSIEQQFAATRQRLARLAEIRVRAAAEVDMLEKELAAAAEEAKAELGIGDEAGLREEWKRLNAKVSEELAKLDAEAQEREDVLATIEASQ